MQMATKLHFMGKRVKSFMTRNWRHWNKSTIPNYSSTTKKGVLYYRTRITDADGKRVDLYATTCEELYKKETEARRVIEELKFRRENPTVAE